MKNFREVENLSAYLDGQLSSSESARLESRLKTDPELDSVLRDLRAARGILRQLPTRKSPRNFTLTRKMVGLKPPLPRTYPLFRLATVFATILFLATFSMNALSPYVSFSAPDVPVFGIGGGGGGAPEAAMEAPAMEEPMMEMAPAEAQEEAPTNDMGAEDTEESVRTMEATPEAEVAPKDVQPESSAPEQSLEAQPQPEVQNEAPVSIVWMIAFLVIGVLGAIGMWFMRRSAASKWR